MANDNNLFREAIERQTVPTYLSRKADIIEHYRDTYGEKTWKSHLAQDMSGSTDKRSKEYRSAMRHFQGDRLAKEGRDKSRWEALGQTLPSTGRVPTNGTLTFTVTGTQHDPYGGLRDRTITWTMKGASAFDFANNPNWIDFWDDYDVDPDLMEEGDYEMEVGSVA